MLLEALNDDKTNQLQKNWIQKQKQLEHSNTFEIGECKRRRRSISRYLERDGKIKLSYNDGGRERDDRKVSKKQLLVTKSNDIPEFGMI